MSYSNDLCTEISKLNPMQEDFILRNLSKLNSSEIKEFNLYIKFCLENDITLNDLAQSYNLIIKDTLKEQVYFMRHGSYRHSTYADVSKHVYLNSEYMSNYMHGLALTAYLWDIHMQIHRFFLKFLNSRKTSGGKYLEIGPGHGFYFMKALQLNAFDEHLGVDISPTSVELTRRILNSKHFGPFSNYKIEQLDFLKWNSLTHFETIVMAEVLEHVEQPQEFLNRIYSFMGENAQAFITTCINAPAVDHIYLYSNLESLENQINESGFIILKKEVIPYSDKTIEESFSQNLPVNVAFVLEKK